MQHLRNFIALREPLGQRQALLMVGVQPGGKITDTAQGDIGIIRTDTLPKVPVGPPDVVPGVFRADDRAHHHIAMSRQVFGGGVYRHIHTVTERLEEKRSTPSVIQDRRNAAFTGHLGDSRDVLDFKGEGPGGLHKNYPGRRLNQGFNLTSHERIVVVHGDIEPRKMLVAERARRRVYRVGHQQMIPRAQKREQGDADRGKPRRHQDGIMAAFKIGKDLLKVKSCWGPQQSIDYFPPVCIWVVALFKGVDIRVENGRGVIYRRIDYTVMLG